MAKNAPTITVNAGDLVLCNDGSSEAYYTACPSTWSLGALPVAAGGWKSVTTAVDATGSGTRYDIGGGNNYGTDLADVPWGSLQPGDAVNIYYRAEPYREKILIPKGGSAAYPLVINGVSDGAGNRPIIDGENAVTLFPDEREVYYPPEHPSINVFEQMLVFIHRFDEADGGVYGETADHIQFQNFHIRNANQAYQYTTNASTETYRDYARGVWIYSNEYVTIEGCVFENCHEGIFAGAPGEKATKTITIRGNKFTDNGYEGTLNSHQIYISSFCEPDEFNVVEGNYFDLIGDPAVAQCKVRSTGAVIRYNTFNSGARIIDLVEAQDELTETIWREYTAQQIIDKYRTSYIYGNLIVNDADVSTSNADWPVHASWDSTEYYALSTDPSPSLADGAPTSRGVDGGITYFFHNTFFHDVTYADNGSWRQGIFDLDGGGVTTDLNRVVAANNVLEFAASARIGQLNASGQLDWESSNLINTAPLIILAESGIYANNENTGDDPAVTINNNDTRISTSALMVDPDNADFLLKDFTLDTGSPALNAATSLPAALSAYPVEYNPVNPATGVMAARSTTNHLGAYE